MKSHLLIAVASLIALAAPASAQGIPGGAAHGWHEGARIAGPVGAVVGGAVGGAVGGVEGLLGVNHAYVGPEAGPPPVRYHRRYKRTRVSYAHRHRHHH
jgi:hypothetical protein